MKAIKDYINSYKFYITTAIAVLLMITTLISVGFGALNKNLSIAGDVEYVQDVGNMIMRWTTSSSGDFHSSAYKDKIRTVDFLDNKNIPNNAVDTWDVSVNPNTRKVMAWVIDDPDNAGYYKLYIGADGDVVGNINSSYIFYGMSELEIISFNNNFDTSKITDMSSMFKIYTGISYAGYGLSYDYQNKLTAINGLECFDTKNVKNMSYMFSVLDKITNLNLSAFDTSSVTTMKGMFSHCESLTNLNLNNFNTSNVSNMVGMFSSCFQLTNLNISTFNTIKVTDFNSMFYQCIFLSNLDVTHFNTQNTTDMSAMFYDCKHIVTLDLNNFDTSKVLYMEFMFSGCDNLTNLNITSFNTSKVIDMACMFQSCKLLSSINVNNFDTSNVTDMSSMFAFCRNITNLDLTNFNSSQVTDMSSMFSGCSYLVQIKISSLWDVSNVTTSTYMFLNSTLLPNYNSSYTDVSMAKPTTQGGYMTLV